MLKTLDSVRLKNGVEMLVRLFSPPEPDYAEKFKHFMRYLDNENIRSVGSRADGKYSALAEDRYFVGEINGRIAGQVWFGWGKHNDPAANFGQVYVDPDFRGLDITSTLMKYWREEFSSSPVIGAMCTCGTPKIRALYTPFGFREIYPGSRRLYCPGGRSPGEFRELAETYYQKTSNIRVVPGTMEHRHETDCLLRFTMETGGFDSERVFVSSAVTSFQDAVFKMEDGRGRVFAALTDQGHCAGWSFCLAPLPDASATFLDYELHPAYKDFEPEIVSETVRQWSGGPLFAAAKTDSKKMRVFSDSGFSPVGKLSLAPENETVLMKLTR
jgi:GNAT superfamily N-acetyltransferase